MKTIPQITIAEPRIRMPAWRRASPKKWNTRPLKMSPKDWPQKRMMSPRLAIQSLGTPASRCRWRWSGRLAPRQPFEPGFRCERYHLITRISGWVASSVWVNT